MNEKCFEQYWQDTIGVADEENRDETYKKEVLHLLVNIEEKLQGDKSG